MGEALEDTDSRELGTGPAELTEGTKMAGEDSVELRDPGAEDGLRIV